MQTSLSGTSAVDRPAPLPKFPGEEEARPTIEALGRDVLWMDRELDDLTGGMLAFDLHEQYFQRFFAISLALIARIDEKMQDPVQTRVLGLIGQGHKPDHLLCPIKDVGNPLQSHSANIGFCQGNCCNRLVVSD